MTGQSLPAACLTILLTLAVVGVLLIARAEVRGRSQARYEPGGPDDFAEWAAQLAGQRPGQDSAGLRAEWLATHQQRTRQRHELERGERP